MVYVSERNCISIFTPEDKLDGGVTNHYGIAVDSCGVVDVRDQYHACVHWVSVMLLLTGESTYPGWGQMPY